MLLQGHQVVSWLVMRAVPLFGAPVLEREMLVTQSNINRDNERICHSSDIETAITHAHGWP